MSAFVIPFPDKSAIAGPAKIEKVHSGSRKCPVQIEAQVERIAALLTELEDLSPRSADVSAALTQSRATIAQVRQRWALSHVPVVEDEGDPQPDVDRETLERHFHAQP